VYCFTCSGLLLGVGILAILAILVAIFLVRKTYRAAEIRTIALEDVTNSKCAHQKVLSLPGVPYNLPCSHVHVEIPLAVERTTVTTTPKGGEASPRSTTFEIVVDGTQSVSLALVLEDDPALAFFLESVPGFLVEVSGGSVGFIENSSRLSGVGVTYEDKVAEATKGVFKLLGDVAGTVIRAPTAAPSGLATTTDDSTRTEKHEKLAGISFKFVKDIQVSTLTEAGVPLTFDAAEKILLGLVNVKLGAEGASPIDKFHKTISGRVKMSPETPQKITATDVMKMAPMKMKIGPENNAKECCYFPGVLYRTPGHGKIQLLLNGTPYAELWQRVPETGQIGWIELRSKLFKKVAPSVDFFADGGVKTLKFSDSTKATEALDAISQMNSSTKSLLEQVKQGEQTKAKAEGETALKKLQLKFQISEKQHQIESWEKQLKEAAPAEKPVIEDNLRTARYDLEILQRRAQLLDAGIEVTAPPPIPK
jgi:hypothetical protein